MPAMPPIAFQPPAYVGPTIQSVAQTRHEHLSPHIGHMYADPLMLVHGHRQYVFDETGRRYLDAFGGVLVTSVGHAVPRVVEAATRQIGSIAHTSMHYVNPVVSDYAEALASKFPDPLDTVVLTNSGSEANDLAILISRLFTGNYDVVGLRNAFHGTISSIVPLIAHKSWRYPVGGDNGITRAGLPYAYRGEVAHDAPDAGAYYANPIRQHIEEATSGRVAAFFAESIQGVGGVIVPPPGFLSAAADHARAAGGLYIADEVQSGFARTGSHWWGFEADAIVPDIVTMAKGIGNGFPMGAIVTRREIAEVLGQRLTYNTYGGSPLACAVGRAVLEEIDEEGLKQNADVCGRRLIDGLAELATRHSIVGDVRGRGLMVGIELVTNLETKEPASDVMPSVLEHLRERGCLVGKSGFAGNVIRITPPLCVTAEDIDFLLQSVAETLTAVARETNS